MIVLYPFYINSELFNIQKKTLIQSLYSAPKKRERESIPQEQRRGDWNWRWGEGNKDPIFLIEVQQWVTRHLPIPFNKKIHMATHFFFLQNRIFRTWRGETEHVWCRTWRLRIIEYSFSSLEGELSLSLSSPPWTLTQIYDGGYGFHVLLLSHAKWHFETALLQWSILAQIWFRSCGRAGQIQYSQTVECLGISFILYTGSWRWYFYIYSTKDPGVQPISALPLTQHVQLF